jgi:hypothetical protein
LEFRGSVVCERHFFLDRRDGGGNDFEFFLEDIQGVVLEFDHMSLISSHIS